MTVLYSGLLRPRRTTKTLPCWEHRHNALVCSMAAFRNDKGSLPITAARKHLCKESCVSGVHVSVSYFAMQASGPSWTSRRRRLSAPGRRGKPPSRQRQHPGCLRPPLMPGAGPRSLAEAPALEVVRFPAPALHSFPNHLARLNTVWEKQPALISRSSGPWSTKSAKKLQSVQKHQALQSAFWCAES